MVLNSMVDIMETLVRVVARMKLVGLILAVIVLVAVVALVRAAVKGIARAVGARRPEE